LAAVDASLLAFFRDDINYNSPQPKTQQVIITLTLDGTIFSMSATFTALRLTGEFGEIPIRASRDIAREGSPPWAGVLDNWELLRLFGARKSTRWIIWHCELEAYPPASTFLITVQGGHARY